MVSKEALALLHQILKRQNHTDRKAIVAAFLIELGVNALLKAGFIINPNHLLIQLTGTAEWGVTNSALKKVSNCKKDFRNAPPKCHDVSCCCDEAVTMYQWYLTVAGKMKVISNVCCWHFSMVNEGWINWEEMSKSLLKIHECVVHKALSWGKLFPLLWFPLWVSQLL